MIDDDDKWEPAPRWLVPAYLLCVLVVVWLGWLAVEALIGASP